MSRKIKKVYKNQWVKVKGIYHTKNMRAIETNFDCCVTNDEVGKTLSIVLGECMVTIPFEPLEKYLG